MQPVRIEGSCLADLLQRVIDARDLTAVQPAIDFLTECGRTDDAEWLRRELGRVFMAWCRRTDSAGTVTVAAPATRPDPKQWLEFAQRAAEHFACDLFTFESIVNTLAALLAMPRPSVYVGVVSVGGN